MAEGPGLGVQALGLVQGVDLAHQVGLDLFYHLQFAQLEIVKAHGLIFYAEGAKFHSRLQLVAGSKRFAKGAAAGGEGTDLRSVPRNRPLPEADPAQQGRTNLPKATPKLKKKPIRPAQNNPDRLNNPAAPQLPPHVPPSPASCKSPRPPPPPPLTPLPPPCPASSRSSIS